MSQQEEERIWGIKRQIVAAILIAIGSAIFVLGFVYPNEHNFHPVTTTLARGIGVSVISYFYARKKGDDLTYPIFHNLKWQFVRNSVMILQGLAHAWAQFYLPLPIVLTLMASSPIFTTMFDSWLFGVNLNRVQKIWLSIAFMGVILTANGNYLFYMMTGVQTQKSSKFANYQTEDPIVIVKVSMLFTLVMFIHGYGILVTKKLIETSAVQINYFLGIMLTTSSGLLAPYAFADPNFKIPSMSQFLTCILTTGVPLAIGQLMFIHALLMTKNYGIITPFMFTNIVVGYLLSIFRYGEQINPICLTGALGIVMGVIFIVRYKENRT